MAAHLRSGSLNAPKPMFAQPHALILRHRERVAVLISSALFLAGALPLFWAIG